MHVRPLPGQTSGSQALIASITSAVERTGYRPGTDIGLVMDPASSEFFRDGVYDYTGEGVRRSSAEQVDYLVKLIDAYPVVSIEDPMAEDDLPGWRDGIASGVANSVLVKVNQIGTLTEALATVNTAHRAGYTVVMPHRSGETEDTTIADLAVATGCGQIKTGSLSRSDRTAKYDQLIRIGEQLGARAQYAGSRPLSAAAGRR